MGLVKATVKTSNGLIVECELTPQTIKELMIKYRVSVREFKISYICQRIIRG